MNSHGSFKNEAGKVRSKDEWRREYMNVAMMEREWFAEGKMEGRMEGRMEGANLFGKLAKKLLSAGREDDISAAADDPELLKRLYQEFGIEDIQK